MYVCACMRKQFYTRLSWHSIKISHLIFVLFLCLFSITTLIGFELSPDIVVLSIKHCKLKNIQRDFSAALIWVCERNSSIDNGMGDYHDPFLHFLWINIFQGDNTKLNSIVYISKRVPKNTPL